jgi:DNA-binding beta-propeller fold protein YncE
MTPDPNNRPGGPNLILTAKSANKIQFFDAATLTKTGELDMPGSTHEMIRSLDGDKVYTSVYGGGIFGKNKDPDRRIAVIDLASKKSERSIDVGDNLAPHSVMMDGRGTLWSTAELGHAVLAIDPATDTVERIDVGGAPHWIAFSHPAFKLFASFKTKDAVAVVDTRSRRVTGTIPIPHGAEGIAVTPNGETLLVCAHRKGVVHVIDARSHALRQTIAIAGAPGEANQLRRVRVSPDGRYVCASSHVDNFAAVYEADTLKQIAGFATPKAPMGFGFAADGRHAFLCCHDDAMVLEFELASGRITRRFSTAAGCEFIIAYS